VRLWPTSIFGTLYVVLRLNNWAETKVLGTDGRVTWMDSCDLGLVQKLYKSKPAIISCEEDS
jgi:hypothetical protein